MNISEIIWRLFQSGPYHMDKHTSESCQELLDSRFYYERMVILLLYIVPRACSSFISIKLYRTVVNIEIELLGKKI